MKRSIILFLIIAALLVTMTRADFLGIKRSDEYIVLPVHPPLDSAGVPGAVDSIQVITYADDGATAVYTGSAADYGCPGIDTTRRFDGTQLWFRDQISNIDGGGGNFQLSLQVITWTDNLPTYTSAAFQVLSDSLNELLEASRDSALAAAVNSGAIRDSMQYAAASSMSDEAMAAVSDSVWDKSRTGHDNAGTFGYYLDASVSSISAPGGDGIYPVTITVVDSSVDQVIPGVRINVYNLPLTARMASGRSDNNGQSRFNLDAGSYVLAASAPGYLFGVYDTLEISAAGQDSLYGCRFDPGSPDGAGLCRVFGYVRAIDGSVLDSVTVAAELAGGVVRFNGIIISPYRREVVTDSTGYFYIDLIPSAALTPEGTKYLLTADCEDGIVLKKKIEIPDLNSWQLNWQEGW